MSWGVVVGTAVASNVFGFILGIWLCPFCRVRRKVQS